MRNKICYGFHIEPSQAIRSAHANNASQRREPTGQSLAIPGQRDDRPNASGIHQIFRGTVRSRCRFSALRVNPFGSSVAESLS
jgi:hypothetical protein